MSKKAIFIAVSIGVTMFFSCGQRKVKPSNEEDATMVKVVESTPKVKIDIDVQSQSFTFVDVNDGKRLSYEKLIVDGKEVVDTDCFDMKDGKQVLFFFDKKTKYKNLTSTVAEEVNGIFLSEHDVMKYKLENDILEIVELHSTKTVYYLRGFFYEAK